MNEQMEFPETFEQFAKEYGFYDDKEVYTNGSELIPLFRVKQWLEHDNKLRTLETDTAYECGKHENKWIPVSERLPEKCEYGNVLVTYIPSGGTLWTTVIIAHYSDLMGIAKPSFHIGEVGKESFHNITEQVIAWMPLPEPYKAESEG